MTVLMKKTKAGRGTENKMMYVFMCAGGGGVCFEQVIQGRTF